MINTNGFLMIEPRKPKEAPVRDELTAAVRAAIAAEPDGSRYRGFHMCVCGATSDNIGHHVTIDGCKYTTNSLAAHYMECHRSEVPARDMELARRLVPPPPRAGSSEEGA